MTELTLCPFCGSKNTKCIYEYEFNGEALRSGGNLRHVCLNCQKEFDAIDIAYRSTMYYESELNNFIKETQEKTTFIENGKIIKTELGGDIMTFWLEIEFDVGVCGFGGYALDNYDEKINKRIGTAKRLQAIKNVLDTVGVDKWEDLKGQYIRCEHQGFGGKIIRIGNLIKNKWFSLEDFFNKEADNG